jgi:acylglycerol lipase
VRFLSRALLAGLTVAVVAGSVFRSRPPARRKTQSARLGDGRLITSDGVTLPLATWLPDDAPAAVILGLHGYGDYRESFRLAGPWLAARGAAVYAYDQRGFGATSSRGEWPGVDALVADLSDAVAVLRATHPELPLVVLGESMGGSVALIGALGEVEGIDALILAAPGVRAAETPLRQLHDLALRLAVLAMPWLAVELRRGARPWLSPAEAERLADDPLILRELSVGTYDGLVDLANRASVPAPATPPPTLALYGELDATIPRQAVDELVERLGDRASLQIYPESHHLLLHEVGTEAILEDCLVWLERTLGDAGDTA